MFSDKTSFFAQRCLQVLLVAQIALLETDALERTGRFYFSLERVVVIAITLLLVVALYRRLRWAWSFVFILSLYAAGSVVQWYINDSASMLFLLCTVFILSSLVITLFLTAKLYSLERRDWAAIFIAMILAVVIVFIFGVVRPRYVCVLFADTPYWWEESLRKAGFAARGVLLLLWGCLLFTVTGIFLMIDSKNKRLRDTHRDDALASK